MRRIFHSISLQQLLSISCLLACLGNPANACEGTFDQESLREQIERTFLARFPQFKNKVATIENWFGPISSNEIRDALVGFGVPGTDQINIVPKTWTFGFLEFGSEGTVDYQLYYSPNSIIGMSRNPLSLEVFRAKVVRIKDTVEKEIFSDALNEILISENPVGFNSGVDFRIRVPANDAGLQAARRFQRLWVNEITVSHSKSIAQALDPSPSLSKQDFYSLLTKRDFRPYSNLAANVKNSKRVYRTQSNRTNTTPSATHLKTTLPGFDPIEYSFFPSSWIHLENYKGKRVLDAGSGSEARIANGLRRIGIDAWGVDEFIKLEHEQDHLKQGKIENMHFFESGFFDRTLMLYVLKQSFPISHSDFSTPIAMLKEAARVTKLGGDLLIFPISRFNTSEYPSELSMLQRVLESVPEWEINKLQANPTEPMEFFVELKRVEAAHR